VIEEEAVVPWRWTGPEVFERDYWCQKSDVWAFGVTLWEIFTNALIPYFEISDDEELKRRVFKEGLRLSQPADCPHSVFEIMSRCWQHQTSHRPSFAELAQHLQDVSAAYFQDGPLFVL
jgi:serine/threonine protein kinase